MIFRFLFILHHIHFQIDHLHFTHCQLDKMRIVNEIYMRSNECERDCNGNHSIGWWAPSSHTNIHQRSRVLKIVIVIFGSAVCVLCVRIENQLPQVS